LFPVEHWLAGKRSDLIWANIRRPLSVRNCLNLGRTRLYGQNEEQTGTAVIMRYTAPVRSNRQE